MKSGYVNLDSHTNEEVKTHTKYICVVRLHFSLQCIYFNFTDFYFPLFTDFHFVMYSSSKQSSPDKIFIKLSATCSVSDYSFEKSNATFIILIAYSLQGPVSFPSFQLLVHLLAIKIKLATKLSQVTVN